MNNKTWNHISKHSDGAFCWAHVLKIGRSATPSTSIFAVSLNSMILSIIIIYFISGSSKNIIISNNIFMTSLNYALLKFLFQFSTRYESWVCNGWQNGHHQAALWGKKNEKFWIFLSLSLSSKWGNLGQEILGKFIVISC